MDCVNIFPLLQHLFQDIWLCYARSETSIALEQCPHLFVCMSRTWRLVVAGLLDNLKWNNSVRRAQTCVGVCASAKGVRAWKVFLASRNVNNSPSTVRINFPRKGAEGWHKGEGAGGGWGLTTETERVLHFFGNWECHSCYAVMKIRNGFIVLKHESRQSSMQDDKTQHWENKKCKFKVVHLKSIKIPRQWVE